ncbi:MAG: stage II sporulation protein M [Bacteroidetes bacterium]|nr:stage II sporulation protein M [Bacteroidota bacterium]
MRETKFIEQNKEKWSKFEKVLESNKHDPEELSELFIEVTDDLSYARTFYPNRSVTVFLNGLAQKIFQKLNGVKYVKKNRFVQFWLEELPHSIFMARKDLLISMVIFLLAVLIGVVSTAYDSHFPAQILGEEYVHETLNNIEKGDPMAIYKSRGEVDMFLGITINNVRVAFLTFILGVFFSAGSVVFMIINGVMLGTFQYFFYQHNLLGTSALTIWQHGTLEIASIVIAGGAGITLGKGLVFPSTYSRGQSFFLAAQSGVRVLLGVVPVLVIAAIIESFYTRFTDAPFWIRLMVIILSLLFLIWYFIWYPYHKSKQGFDKSFEAEQVFSWPKQSIDFSELKSSAQIVADTFTLYSRHFKKIFRFSFFLALLSVLLIYFFGGNYFLEESKHVDGAFDLFFGFVYFFDFYSYPILFVINVLAFSLSIFVAFYLIQSEEAQINPKPFWRFLLSLELFKKSFFLILMFQALLSLLLFYNGFSVFLFFCFWPLITLLQFLFYKMGVLGIGKFFFFFKQSVGKMLWVYLCIGVLSFILHLLAHSPLMGLYITFFKMNFNLDAALLTLIVNGIWLLIGFLFIYLIASLFAFSSSILFYTLQEIGEANDLNSKIQNFGQK